MKFDTEKNQLNDLIQKIPQVSGKEEIFNLMCQISKIAESYTNSDLQELSSHNNFYVDPIWNVFHNSFFLKNIKTVLSLNYDNEEQNDFLEERQVTQLFLRLSFLMVSVLVPVLREDTIFFLREHFSASLKHIHNELSDMCDMRQLLLVLEEINYDAKYRFEKKTPVTLNTNFLNMNQISSRIFVGFLVLSNISYWILPQLFGEIVKNNKHPAKLFKTAKKINLSIGEYNKFDFLLSNKYFNEKRKKALMNFINLLRDQNIEDIVFLIAEVGTDYSSPDKYRKSAEGKITNATYIRSKIQKRFETLDVFVENIEKSGRWSNKAFLNTIIFFAALESIKDAKDALWKSGTFDHFLNRWLNDLHEIINYHYMDSFETIVVYVEGLSDKMILENAYKKLYPKHSNFTFYHTGGKQELFKKINAAQINDFERKSIGIFDFDEAYNDFNGLRKIGENSEVSGFCEIQGEEHSCLFRVRENSGNKVLAVLLPVPESRKNVASKEFENKSLLSIEMLFEDETLKKNENLGRKSLPGSTMNMFVGDKVKFAEKTKDFNKSEFKNFVPLFKRLFEIMK